MAYVSLFQKMTIKKKIKKELIRMVDPQSCSSSNRASMDGTGDEKEEEAWMVPVMRKKKRQERLMDPSSPSYKMFCYQG